jgi:hypothetical protein
MPSNLIADQCETQAAIGLSRSEGLPTRGSCASQVVSLLAEKLSAKPSAVEERMRELVSEPAEAVSRRNHADVQLSGVQALLDAAFCRRCRVFSCPTHAAPHVK